MPGRHYYRISFFSFWNWPVNHFLSEEKNGTAWLWAHLWQNLKFCSKKTTIFLLRKRQCQEFCYRASSALSLRLLLLFWKIITQHNFARFCFHCCWRKFACAFSFFAQKRFQKFPSFFCPQDLVMMITFCLFLHWQEKKLKYVLDRNIKKRW